MPGLVETLQFHPAYAYEDFIQGIRPTVKEGALSYELQAGRFVDFCRRAEALEGVPCVLILDEINRANLPRVRRADVPAGVPGTKFPSREGASRCASHPTST